MSPLGPGCRKGGSSLALLPKHLFWGSKISPQTLQVPLDPVVCESLSLAELSLRKRVRAVSSHSIFPWISSLQGFALSPWSQGRGWKCPIKNQLRNVSKSETKGVRVSPWRPQPWDPPLWVLAPWVKHSGVQSWNWCQQG